MLVEVLGGHPCTQNGSHDGALAYKSGNARPFGALVMLIEVRPMLIEVRASGCRPRQSWVCALASLYNYRLARTSTFGTPQKDCQPSSRTGLGLRH